MMLPPIGLFIGIYLATLGSCQVPEITGSYRAFGEIVTIFPGMENSPLETFQMQFEENYDADTGDSAFALKALGSLSVFLANNQTNKIFNYIKDTDGLLKCVNASVEEWEQNSTPPFLSKYVNTDGSIKFALGQLFALEYKYLEDGYIPSEIRGIPANRTIYEIRGFEGGSNVSVEINAYWSEPSRPWGLFPSSGNTEPVPLRFSIVNFLLDQGEKKAKVKVLEQFINVFAFLRGSVDKTVFQARQGVVCPNRNTTIKFPAIENYPAVSFRAEIVLPDYSEIKTVDGWFDTGNKFLRLNMDRIKDSGIVMDKKTGQKWVSEVISGSFGVVFRVTSYKGKAECKVIPLKDYEFDFQDIINPKLSDWSLQNVFGLSDTNYVYIGKATKRNIPCYVFQGVRKDWPETSAGVTSLWEWCIAMHHDKSDDNVIFRDNELPLINLEIKILESKSPADYPTGFKLIHNFYDVKVEDPKFMDLTSFDIKYCFEKDNRKDLQFSIDVNINPENIDKYENVTSDVEFLQTWKLEIAVAAGLGRETLRITRVQSNVIADKLFVRFTLLGLHEDLPEESKKGQKSLAEAEAGIKSAIDDGKLVIFYMMPNVKEHIISATKNSLTEQVNKTLIDQVPTPGPPDPVTDPSSEKPTGSPITMVTDPSDFTLPKSSSSVVTDSSDSTSSKSSSSVVTDSNESTSSKSSSSVVTDSNESTSPKSSSSMVTGSNDATSSTSPPTKVTDPNNFSSTQPPTVVLSGHQPGTVAAVTILMLLVGIVLGSAGTFVKFKGMSSFRK